MMKEKPKKNKLVLNKETISFLDKREMENLKGGTSTNIQIIDILPGTLVFKTQPDPWRPEPVPWNIINIPIKEELFH